ncbi:MAG: hypothetical protein R3D66_06740 [Alphaproteobacteria bacterium]
MSRSQEEKDSYLKEARYVQRLVSACVLARRGNSEERKFASAYLESPKTGIQKKRLYDTFAMGAGESSVHLAVRKINTKPVDVILSALHRLGQESLFDFTLILKGDAFLERQNNFLTACMLYVEGRPADDPKFQDINIRDYLMEQGELASNMDNVMGRYHFNRIQEVVQRGEGLSPKDIADGSNGFALRYNTFVTKNLRELDFERDTLPLFQFVFDQYDQLDQNDRYFERDRAYLATILDFALGTLPQACDNRNRKESAMAYVESSAQYLEIVQRVATRSNDHERLQRTVRDLQGVNVIREVLEAAAKQDALFSNPYEEGSAFYAQLQRHHLKKIIPKLQTTGAAYLSVKHGNQQRVLKPS